MKSLLTEQLNEQMDGALKSLGIDSFDSAGAALEVRTGLAQQVDVNALVFDETRYDNHKKFSSVLTDTDSVERFGKVIQTLQGRIIQLARLESGKIVTRSALVGGLDSLHPRLSLYMVGDDNFSAQGIANHRLMVSGVRQFEATGIAAHDRVQRVGAEAGHLMVNLGGTVLPRLGASLHRGVDVTDAMKLKGNLVTTLADSGASLTPYPGKQLSFTFAEWGKSGSRLIWPLTAEHFEAGPPAADVADAIPLATVHAFQQVRKIQGAAGIDQAKQFINNTTAAQHHV